MRLTLEFEIPETADEGAAMEILRDLVDVHEVESALKEMLENAEN